MSTFGLRGELILKHNLGKKTALKDLRAIFIEQHKNSFIPWFIAETRIRSETEILVRLEGVNVKEEALPLAQKEVWLAEEDFKKYAAKSAPINLLGFDVVDQKQVLGPIKEVIEQPHQLLCKIDYQGKEALIPINESTLRKIDRRNQRVIVQLPEGLLEIYL